MIEAFLRIQILSAFLTLGLDAAAPNLVCTDGVTIVSRSRQFQIHGTPLAKHRISRLPSTSDIILTLDPATTVVSCERIKDSLLRTLGLPDHWQGKIRASIEPATSTNQPIDIHSVWYAEGWQYWIRLPIKTGSTPFIRAIVQVLLLEIANRTAGTQSAEIPFWLAEGLTGYLLSLGGNDMVLQPYSRLIREDRQIDFATLWRSQLAQSKALTFTEISLPNPDLLQGDDWAYYRIGSQLLVAELLRLPNGRQALQQFLRMLPEYHNWQTAFLRAYSQLFTSLLDVEKWWSLILAGQNRRDPLHSWSPMDTLDKLDELLRLPIWISQSPEDMPKQDTIPIQDFISMWDFGVQQEHLQQLSTQLAVLELKAQPDLASLIASYRRTMLNYLKQRQNLHWRTETLHRSSPSPKVTVDEVLHRLNALDKRREQLRVLKRTEAAQPIDK